MPEIEPALVAFATIHLLVVMQCPKPTPSHSNGGLHTPSRQHD